jgi:hypothetical protein
MAHSHNDSRDDKISPAFKVRLEHMEPQQKVRAIVMLHSNDPAVAPGRRQLPAERQAAIEAMRKSAEPALDEIDHVLSHFGGKRLAPSVNALGSVPVEATPAGLTTLSTLESVEAILEDQPISLLSGLSN